MIDRYTKAVLTVIAAALLYLCVVMTAFPAVHAQSSVRPGDPTGPAQVVVVGWQARDMVPITIQQPVPVVNGAQPFQVVTERSSRVADRVVLSGIEIGSQPGSPGRLVAFTHGKDGLPVLTQP